MSKAGNPEQRARSLFSPNAFLRARRPERFSDSTVVDVQPLDRSQLEYHLETLTSRSQENDFERFARILLEREVCPNLLPHTGPTGGGDSKVDSETYPVADDLASVWYIGEGRKASKERWAFAFSAKRDWRSKCQSDVKKIAETNRGYRKAFFVTSQFVPDRSRAEVEAKLQEKHGFDVRIFDRTWLLERVYAGKHQQLAIDTLGLQGSIRTETVTGPFDAQREKDLAEVDTRIEQTAGSGILGLVFVQDLLRSALLARSLERPRAEIEGRFGRAREAAEKCGSQHQQITTAYQEAFTALWWFEDYPSFLNKLTAFEKLITEPTNAYYLELATGLWMALWTAVHGNFIDAQQARLDERAAQLTAALDAMAGWAHRPSSALQAETLAIQIRLLTSSPEARDDLLKQLKGVIERSGGLLGYPLAAVVESVAELGVLFTDIPSFNELFAAAVQTISTRDGEVTAARLLLKRGMQQLDDDKAYPAISTIGQALARLHNEESMPDLVRALYILGSAYERVGLLWAARGSLLYAASIATNPVHGEDVVSPIQTACYDHLRWIELRLGRIPHALAWHEVTRAAKAVLAQRGVDCERLARGDCEFDVIMGILLLRTDVWELKWYARIVGALEDLDLQWAALSLQFALGHEEAVMKKLVGMGEHSPNMTEFFSMLANQPAADDLPSSPSSYHGRTASIVSHILGCEVRADTDVAPPCPELTESVVAALESFLATGMVTRKPIISCVPLLSIKVRSADFADAPFQYKLTLKDGNPLVEVRVPKWSPHSVALADQHKVKDKLLELVATLVANAFTMEDYEQTLTNLIRDERATERAVNFTGSMVTVANVLGDKPKHLLSDWEVPEDRAYPLRRSEPWSTNARAPVARAPHASAKTVEANGAKNAHAAPPNWQDAKHSDIRMVSLISLPLWNKAKWTGTLFLGSTDDSQPPALAPVFRGGEAAVQIFLAWRKELGATDEQDLIRISIVRGIDARNPHAYRIVIGADLQAALTDTRAPKFAMTAFRVNQMDPSSSANLDQFLGSYAKHGAFDLLPAYTPPGAMSPIPASDQLWIRKQKLHVVNAWQIGVGDLDSPAITADTRPIIPMGHETDAPVLAVLASLKSRDRT